MATNAITTVTQQLTSVCLIMLISEPMIQYYKVTQETQVIARELMASTTLGAIAGLVLYLPAFWIYFFKRLTRSSKHPVCVQT